MAVLQTPITELFGIQHPIMLAGMNVAAGPALAAAVSNSGGLGVIGGIGCERFRSVSGPLGDFSDLHRHHLRGVIKDLKKDLRDPKLPFGVDLLIPQVGGSARKTNYDYTKGQLPELIDVIIEEGAKLFVCAVGVPPKWAVDKLHEHGIPVMNMIGAVKHVDKALAVGVDIICAQGGEGGGHTGSTPFSILIPNVVDACKGRISPLTGKPVLVVAAGGISDGRGLAASLMYGASAVWVGTRFVASVEAGAPKKHKELVVTADYGDTATTLIYTGRPLRVRRTDYVKSWERRQPEIEALTQAGKLPHEQELAKHPEYSLPGRPWLMGDVAAAIKEVLPAKTIIDEMVQTAKQCLQRGETFVVSRSKL